MSEVRANQVRTGAVSTIGPSIGELSRDDLRRPDDTMRAPGPRMPLVGLITIWYRDVSALDRFRVAREVSTYPRIRLVFISQGLSREARCQLAAVVPEATILETGGNIGTAAAWNLGIAALLAEGADYIGIWNPDVHPAPNAIEELVRACEYDDTIGACQPVLLFSDTPSTVQMYGGTIDMRTGRTGHAFAGMRLDDVSPLQRNASYLDGGTMLIRAEALRGVGGFDERFFLYCEDVDLSLRLQMAGWRTVAVRAATAWHYHRAEHGQLPTITEAFYDTRNRFYLVRKHRGPAAIAPLIARTILGLPRVIAGFVKRGHPELARAVVGGVICGMLGRTGKQGRAS